MNKNDLELKLLNGSPIEIGGLGLLYPLLLNEITQIGELKYNQLLSVILFNQQPIKIEEKELSKFETLMVYCFHDELFRNIFIESISTMFKEEVYLHPSGFFYFGDVNEQRIISPEKYDEIVDIIKQQNFINNQDKEEEYKPHDERAKKLIEKIKQFKQKIKEANAEDGLNLSDIISIVSAYSSNLNIFNVWDLTVYQLYTLYIRLMMKDSYESQFQLMLQGADIKSSDVKHWATKLNK